MSHTGMIRKVDELGRIVLPVELRHSLDINTHDTMAVRMEDDEILLWKVQTSCTFCDSEMDLHAFKTKQICGRCLEKLRVLQEEDED
ncbi:MAG: AbrB/MazE/SpoVT family DNA-binding domain-containing protein [Oscillospiraceae bacterium]|nr:AbrB/MazE/SpoVT family DNA-binding domain-containing protein [Oscillospiraceae bacterium]